MSPTVILAILAVLWLAYETCVQVADWRYRRRMRLDREQLWDRGIEWR